MKILKLVQGSNEWLEARLNHLCASEAPAMMDDSKFMSRNQLLDLKKGWQSNPNSSFKEALFQKGHDSEDSAREILELDELEDYPAVVGMASCSTLEGMLASFDGLAGDHDCFDPWEHKEWNETLAENVRNGVLEPHYFWQLEHQMLVADCNQIKFTCSDGTEEKRVSMVYESVPARRKDLIAGWKQFIIDLDSHLLEAKQEMVKVKKEAAFPLITFDVTGTQITSNIASCLEIITQKAEIEIGRKLESDQDFADKDKLNKATKEARDKLKLLVDDVQGKFVSYAEFAGVAADIDKVLQKMQSQGEKQVLAAKTAKKKAIESGGIIEVNEFIKAINIAINPIQLSSLMNCSVDFSSAMKNKRTIESLQNSVDSVVAEFKIAADEIKHKVVANLLTLRELAGEYEFLFMDSSELVKKDNEDLVAVIKIRIAEHKTAEEANLAKIKEDAEVAAKAKLEAEQKAKDIEAEIVKNATSANPEVKIDNVKPYIASVEDGVKTPVKARLASRFESVADSQPENEQAAEVIESKHDEMIRRVKFWAKDYGVISSELSDLMNILNQYK